MASIGHRKMYVYGEQMTKAISLCWSTARLMVLLLASTLQCDSQTIDRSPLSRDLHRPEPWLAHLGERTVATCTVQNLG